MGAHAGRRGMGVAERRRALLWWRRWRWYERNALPWNRARIHRHMLRREAFIRFPVHGNVLEALDDGRLAIGRHTLLEPGCWLTLAEGARIDIGEGCFLNLGTMVAALERVTIGAHTMLANGCFVGDGEHRYDELDRPITWQGFTTKGPVSIGSNCWLGVNCVVTSGVTVGDRCVVGANSVVTRDLPPGVVAAGAPARVIRPITFRQGGGGG
jgi:acetyltransferase-like isoleucine patch superfamily enzyme